MSFAQIYFGAKTLNDWWESKWVGLMCGKIKSNKVKYSSLKKECLSVWFYLFFLFCTAFYVENRNENFFFFFFFWGCATVKSKNKRTCHICSFQYYSTVLKTCEWIKSNAFRVSVILNKPKKKICFKLFWWLNASAAIQIVCAECKTKAHCYCF